MINFSDIKDLLYTWLYTYTNKITIWQDQAAPRPNLPYLTLRIQSLSSVGHEYTSVPNNSGMIKISGIREMTVNVQAYGENSFSILEDLHSINALPESQELLLSKGLILVDVLNLTNITGLNEYCPEERATTDLLFRFGSQRVNANVGLIENVNIEGNLKNPDKQFTFERSLLDE